MNQSSICETGKVYLVGAGPGDPGLLTLRGREALEAADCVIYDRLANPVLLEFAPSWAERIFAGKHGGGNYMPQQEIHRLMISHARAGEVVVRLKGGDPFLFGRGGEEAEALTDAGIPWQVVPGVSSALAVPACAGIPVTHRDLASSLAVVTAHERDGIGSRIQWDKLATGADTLVVLMCHRNLGKIAAQLVEHGRPAATPAAVIEWGTYRRQKVAVGTLESIARLAGELGMGPPVTLVVGEVAAMASRPQPPWEPFYEAFSERTLSCFSQPVRAHRAVGGRWSSGGRKTKSARGSRRKNSPRERGRISRKASRRR